MQRKKLFLGLAMINVAILTLTTAVILTNPQTSPFIGAGANTQSYAMEFTKDKNKLTVNGGNTAYDGTAYPLTNLGNKKRFDYYQLKGVASSWQVLGDNDGYFYNVDPINGIQSISMTFGSTEKSYKILYSRDTSFDQAKEFTTPSESESSMVYGFDGYLPNYFKVLNTSGSNLVIKSLTVDFSCVNNYPSLTLVNENEDMGSINGPSYMTAGTKTTITATPNTGYKFVGWYFGDKLISDKSTYTFTAGNEDLTYSARFTYDSYNLVVKSEDNEKGTVSESTGTYDYLTQITIDAKANDGYTFDGWYEDSSLVSKDNPYTFNMPYSDTTYVAKFTTNSYDVVLKNANSDLGAITGSGSFLYKSSVTLTASPNTGVSFLGWYNGDELVSSSAAYTFDMPHEDLEYIAKFEWTPYSVELNVNDSSMGSVSGAGSYIYQQEVTLKASPVEHHSFAGWYDGNELVSMENPYVFNLPDKSLSYTAKFVKNYKITVTSDDLTKGSVSAPEEWGEGLEVTIKASANVGYALKYWYDENTNELSKDASYTFVMPGRDISYGASFTTGYTLTVTSSDETKGTVSGSGQYVAGRSVTASATGIDDCVFKGWYNGESLLSKDNPYTFTMPANDYSLVARFMTKAEEEEERNKKLGIIPVINEDEKTLTYGLYPQSHVSDSSTIAALNNLTTAESNGWYLYNDEYYVKKSANPNDSSYTFDDGTTIVSGTEYWFKCEPIEWIILTSSNGTYSLVSTKLLDVHRYNEYYTGTKDGYYANNYMNSEIRSWLNKDFLNTAFSLDSSLIQTTLVDNSASTTDSSSNSYACANTNDKIYLLSYKDYSNTTYFADDSARMCKPTDYALASYCFQYNGNGWYYTRSPTSYDSSGAWSVTYGGYLNYSYVNNSYVGVRPALTINL